MINSSYLLSFLLPFKLHASKFRILFKLEAYSLVKLVWNYSYFNNLLFFFLVYSKLHIFALIFFLILYCFISSYSYDSTIRFNVGGSLIYPHSINSTKPWKKSLYAYWILCPKAYCKVFKLTLGSLHQHLALHQ